MKIENKLTIIASISALLGFVGCAHQDRYAKYDESIGAPAYGSSTTTYDNRSATYNSSGTAATPGAQSSIGSSTAGGSDQKVLVQVRQALNNNPNLTEVVPNIEVSGTGGTIILTGSVPTEQQKQAIETQVKSTTGVVTVNNQLQVSLSPTSKSDKSTRIYSNSTSQAESTLPSSSKASLSETNRSDSSGQGLSPTSGPNQEPRLYPTNDTGKALAPQSSIQSDTSGAGLPSTGTNSSPSESKGLTVTANTGGSLYSNGPSASVSGSVSGTQNSTPGLAAHASVNTSNQVSPSSVQGESEKKELPATSNSGETRRYSGSQTNSAPKDTDRIP
jgi:hypothetical protein